MVEEMMFQKPLPDPNGMNKEILAALKRHEIVVQRCKGCGMDRRPPQPMCPNCYSPESEWRKVGNKGKVFSYNIMLQPPHPAFKDDAPIGLVYVEMDDCPGCRWMANIVDMDPWELYCEMPVEAVFDDVTPEVTMLRFKKAA